ncbi:putative CBF1 interacting corepressor CIR [Balamuthia mandrillaris]
MSTYMSQKSWHPKNKANQKRIWMAEEKAKHEAQRQKEAQRQFEEEQTRFQNNELVKSQGKSGSSSVAPLSFLYATPPGYKPPSEEKKEQEQKDNSTERQKGKDKRTQKKEPPPKLEDKFDFLKNAPTTGSYTKDIKVHHRPLGKEVRNVKCARCGQWGHQSGDRECPMFHVNPNDSFRQRVEDPLASGLMQQVQQQMENERSQEEEDRLVLKPHLRGPRLDPSNPNHQMIPEPEGEGGAPVDPEVEFLQNLSSKERKLLLKYFKKTDRQEAERKEKKEKSSRHHKKKRRREKEDKEERKKSRREKDDRKRRKRSKE